jgi:hypothetical protein
MKPMAWGRRVLLYDNLHHASLHFNAERQGGPIRNLIFPPYFGHDTCTYLFVVCMVYIDPHYSHSATPHTHTDTCTHTDARAHTYTHKHTHG